MRFLSPLVFILVCAGCMALLLRLFEPRLIFFPLKELVATPAESGSPYEDVFFETSDGVTLHGWFMPATKSRGTVLFCHGNAGNISHRLEKAAFFLRSGFNVFMFDYRGYGRSLGRPSEEGVYRDAEAAHSYLISRGIRQEDMVGYGESLGGVVIVDLASKKPLRAFILENTFTNAREMAALHYPFLPSQILKSRFDSKQKIAAIKTPKLILHSRNDEIVPFRMGRGLYETAADPKDFLEIRGDHNSGFFASGDLIEEKLESFLVSLKK